MKLLVKAIVTGFGLSVGAYVFRKISIRYNLEPLAPSAAPPVAAPNPGMATPESPVHS